MANILVIEDESGLSLGIQYNLEQKGHSVSVCEKGSTGLSKILSDSSIDLVILDAMLPELDGFEILKVSRAQGFMKPVLMLTALHDLKNKLKGLTLGADDYMGKPFALEELIARVDALLRARDWAQNKTTTQEQTRDFLGASFSVQNLTLKKGTKEKQLTLIESKLLEFLLQKNGDVASRAEILQEVWGLNENVQTRTLDNFVARFRSYFEDLGIPTNNLESIRGVGYRLKI
ncbi:MAG: response regulator transcription factor [Bacteriovoracia bacterium]